ncbi:uncharacterized protein MAM_04609 [Metarhizium album ARSEF 1941]|uniref:Px domain containing protein n=1 Tax=Metarhizium album (strain ARSEF 1941) TaxID=1081103 RepID=A0A0B2WVD7_METAS|nr:uncharacterized protein MAM_04609 [Metarhizium album ARSEF 1941]KHN97594.1 hypothetical protein MAM_04609 [Metarhizium album ARSEF 1941]
MPVGEGTARATTTTAASSPGPATGLSLRQTRALFDILTHYETYAEISSFKAPGAIASYGFPFRKESAMTTTTTTPCATAPSTPRARTPIAWFSSSEARKERPASTKSLDGEDDRDYVSTSPILQLLLTRIVLPLPGIGDIPRSFWNVRVQSIMSRLGEAELSESYDKGAMGTRKTLATGTSAVIEMLGRGILGGVDKQESSVDDSEYHDASADDLGRAWGNVIEGLVYGDLVDQLFDHFVHSDDLESLSPTVKASVRHNILHIAALVHQIFILSPEGQYLLKLLENVHSLVPYTLLKSTLRIGNAATMLSGMIRILLAKLSVASVTNWVGLTQNADDGMNLLQRIVAAVLSWDASEFKKSAEKVEKAKDGPTDEMLRTIREHIDDARSEHDTVREASQQNSQSIITAIFNARDPALNERLTETQHAQCLEYYSALLSVRDRDCITGAICRQPPDMFTQAIKDVVAAYEPMIRTVHSHVDLREHFDAFQIFLEEFIRASRPKKSLGSTEEKMASVEDYVDLLMRHQRPLYRWIHALASQCPDIWERLRAWGNEMIAQFRKPSDPSSDVHSILNKLYTDVEAATQPQVLEAINSHAAYLDTVNAISHARMQYLVTAADSAGGTTKGPGMYMDRWQSLLDETPITPGTRKGAVRRGKDVKHITTMGKTGPGGKNLERNVECGHVPAPDVSVVVSVLGARFRNELRGLALK